LIACIFAPERWQSVAALVLVILRSVVAPDLFLPNTWRLHNEIAQFLPKIDNLTPLIVLPVRTNRMQFSVKAPKLFPWGIKLISIHGT
jgi:hypothetical protein